MEEIQVNEDKLREKIKVFFGKKVTQNLFANKYMSIFKGKGLEFESFKDYVVGDDADRIDWKASKRANKLLIRQYTTEKEIDVMFMFDIGSSMYFSSTGKLKVEYAIEVIITLSFLAMKAGSKVGLLMFSDDIVKLIKFGAGAKQDYVISKTLLNAENYPGGNSNVEKAYRFSTNFLSKNTIIFLISDFLNFDADWRKTISVMSFKYDTIGVMIRDPIDKNLPKKGNLRVISPNSEEEIIINTDTAAEKYNELMKKNESEISRFLANHRADFLPLTSNKEFFHPIIKFLKRRSSTFR